MSPRNPPWNHDELVLALDLYFRIDFARDDGRITAAHPQVIELSGLLNRLAQPSARLDPDHFRNPNAVRMKLSNFLRLDPAYSGRGLIAGGKGDVEVWNEYYSDKDVLAQTARTMKEYAAAPSWNPCDDIEVAEGGILLRQHRTRERNRSLALRKKQIAYREDGRLSCEVCGFVFSHVYGPLGDGYIECHHTVPLHQLKPGHATRIQDLALVCANCHRMLHRDASVSTIEQLRTLTTSWPK